MLGLKRVCAVFMPETSWVVRAPSRCFRDLVFLNPLAMASRVAALKAQVFGGLDQKVLAKVTSKVFKDWDPEAAVQVSLNVQRVLQDFVDKKSRELAAVIPGLDMSKFEEVGPVDGEFPLAALLWGPLVYDKSDSYLAYYKDCPGDFRRVLVPNEGGEFRITFSPILVGAHDTLPYARVLVSNALMRDVRSASSSLCANFNTESAVALANFRNRFVLPRNRLTRLRVLAKKRRRAKAKVRAKAAAAPMKAMKKKKTAAAAPMKAMKKAMKKKRGCK